MRLRRIVLSGFKTFARHSEVLFEPGITGVVGPNGSGKSNLVDAIRWALGETNAREIRGTRMDEVIYAGGAGRGRMGVAEVHLVIDNQEGRLPVDDPEVAISRRVVRGGDIEYRLNGERARLRDVDRLLGATGLTQSGYAVVGQNDIEAIIEATPRQRRALVEQAAGVRPLRVACEDALHRLDQVDLAVQRLLDRLDESEPRLGQLAVEAEVALEQRVLGDRLGELRGSLAREEWRSARAQLRQAVRRLEAAGRRLEAANEAETGFSALLEAERAELSLARLGQRQAADRLEAARLGAERAGGEVRRWADRCSSAVLHRAGARTELRSALADLAAAEAAAAELDGSDLDVRRVLEELERSVAAVAERSAVAEVAAAGSAGQVAAADAELKAAVDGLIAAEAAAAQLTAQLNLFGDAASSMEAELATVRDRVAELELATHATASRRRQQQEAVDAAAAEAGEASRLLTDSRSRLRAAEATLMATRETTRHAVARAASLHGQVEGALGGGGAIAEAAGEIGAVRLVDAIRVKDPDDAAAVEAALEVHLGAWIVDDVEAATARLRTSRAREEILNAGPPGPGAALPSPFEGVRPALDAVDVDAIAGAAAELCLAATWLVADLGSAARVVAGGHGSAVLADGTVVTRFGVRGGGGSGNTLELVAAAHAGQLAAEAAGIDEEAALSQVRTLTNAVAIADSDAARLVAELAAARVRLADCVAANTAAEAAGAAELLRAGRIETALRRRAEETTAVAAAAVGARSQADGALRRQAELRTAAEAARRSAAEHDRLVAQSRAELRELELSLLERRRAAAEVERRGAEVERLRGAAEQRAAVAEARVAAAETEAVIAIVRGRTARSAAADAARGVVRAFEELELTSSPLAELEARVLAIEQDRGEVRVALARAQDETAAAGSEAVAAEQRVAELAEAVRDEVDDESAELDPAAAEKAEREIIRLERRIAAMGPVNGLAPEQHAGLLERVGGLRQDRDDLSLAAAEVRNLARRLSGEAQRRFDSVFVAVGAHFADLFGELFPGGSATLHLEDAAAAESEEEQTPEEVQQRRGIEILAQPPGKKLQPLSHLSGGERALTSMAVIFALQQVNPSPFYVFDEVDAPLDDTNVLRFTRLLGRLARTQQFIVITHNHVTMAAADALYGVTIDREGVSSVLSVRFAPDPVPRGDIVGVVQVPLHRAAS